MPKGCLYVCATPIGNLEDITLRVLRILREADFIAAEDTRRTRQLLAHYDIHTPLISLHEHNEAARAAGIVDRISAGAAVALVSDAGMPGISDPGLGLIRAAIDAGVPLTVLPGPTAFVAALVGSGLPADRFVFEGFPPRQPRRRRAFFRRLRDESRTLVFYEAPHRVRATLRDMVAELGDRPACVARELTKAFEQWQRAPLRELADSWHVQAPRGEYVIVVAGADGAGSSGTDEEDETEPVASSGSEAERKEVLARVRWAMQAGADKKTAVRQVARDLNLPRRFVYDAATVIDAADVQSDSTDSD